jgi:hypothetical protein
MSDDDFSLESLASRIVHECKTSTAGRSWSPPASEAEIDALARAFQRRFRHALPESYKRVLQVANGLHFNGMTLWPTARKTFPSMVWESLIEVNIDLREGFAEEFLYFGQMDEELYVFEPSTGIYKAIEYTCLDGWKTFKDAEAMLVYLLRRALAIFDDEADAGDEFSENGPA